VISLVVRRLDSAYPSAPDRAAIESYLATVKSRRAALTEVRRVTAAVAEDTVERIKGLYPQFTRYHAHGYEKGRRDMALLTAMVANAMFLGEDESLDDMFTHWYRTIVKGVHMSRQFMQDTFRFWHQALEKHLSDEAYALLRPHAEHLAGIVGDLPVLARDEVGERRAAAAV
jgi:hypothetical protein